ncbi:RagB/SusD family nutrient uptake outer membrane protein [uncultured Winogradskyella sp.]|uniref:RagB/SusD family nutrient uptake outer membrane protein n=1 Tax=Winogradskyella sp. 4-2091 TaxID=3381659 RepID=UPI002621AEB5|nr:RagB/SusD family nutrient uptake outer membrane protein [uncultured Winogradskyella sp.]
MKKGNLKKLLTVALILPLFYACNEDFLEEPSPQDAVTESVVFSSKENAMTHMSGILRRTRAQYTNNDSAGVNSLYYARAVKGNDVVQGPTWFLFDYAHENREPNYRRTIFTWNYCYDIINNLNVFIKGVSDSSISAADKNELLAQGYGLRAFYYFQLVMEFQHTYTYDASLPALPIYTEPAVEGKAMSTVQEVYDFIINDLVTARDIAVDDRLGKSYLNKNVINGILARVYLVTENWSGAATAASAASVGYPLQPALYGAGFSDASNPEWIWAYQQSSDQSNFYWGAPHSHADHSVLSYQGTYFNETFVNRFTATDVRNRFIGGFYGVPSTAWNYWTTDKFMFEFSSDFGLMRSAEMMLIEAEGLARSGSTGLAQAKLFELQSDRDPSAVASGNSGAALIEEILVERRKELYAELGVEWFDAKRLRRGITRDGNHRVFFDVPADGNEYRLKIPEAEIDANDFIEPSVNDGR